MPYTFTLTTTIPASARQIYDAWLDSLAHSEMTGSKANMSNEVGVDVSAWGDYITGRNLELIPGERIVQSWRTAQFVEEHEDSIITVILEEAENGTLLTLVHSNVPDNQKSYEQGGWEQHYFGPMKKYFADRIQAETGETSKRTTPRDGQARGSNSLEVEACEGEGKGKGQQEQVAPSCCRKCQIKSCKKDRP